MTICVIYRYTPKSSSYPDQYTAKEQSFSYATTLMIMFGYSFSCVFAFQPILIQGRETILKMTECFHHFVCLPFQMEFLGYPINN